MHYHIEYMSHIFMACMTESQSSMFSNSECRFHISNSENTLQRKSMTANMSRKKWKNE